MTRRQVVLRLGASDAMSLVEDEAPSPGPGQMRLAVERAGVALSDVLMRQGRYPGGPKPPFTPGWDVAGTVDAIGDGVDPALVGERLVALVFDGGYAAHALVGERLAARIPEGVSFDAAACLTLNYVTAWQMIRRIGHARPGERLLVRGAAGGVGTAALDIARALGLRAWGASSPMKVATVERYGATWVAKDGLEVAAGSIDGFDIVLDPLGGGETWRAMRLLAPGGRVVTYGFTAFSQSLLPLRIASHLVAMKVRSLMPGGRSASLFRLSRSARTDPEAYRDDLNSLLDLLAAGELEPLVADVLPLSAAAEAHRCLESLAVEGKLLLDPNV